MTKQKKPKKKPMKEQPHHKEAFEHFYLKLNEGMSVSDSILSVAEKFKVTERTVYRWHKELNWDDKIAVRDIDIQDALEDKTNTTIVDNKAKYLGIVHFSLNKYVEEVNNGDRDPIPIENSRDLERLIKTGLLIQNQPTDISEQNGSVKHELTGKYEVTKKIICSPEHIEHELAVLNATGEAQGCNK